MTYNLSGLRKPQRDKRDGSERLTHIGLFSFLSSAFWHIQLFRAVLFSFLVLNSNSIYRYFADNFLSPVVSG